MIQAINLMPVELQRRRFLFDRAKAWGAVLAVTCAALAISAAWLRVQTRSMRRQLASDESIAVRLADANSTVEKLRKRRASFRAKQSVLHRLTASRGWDVLAVEVADATGDGIWLQELHVSQSRQTSTNTGDTRKVEQTTADASGQASVTMTLSGFAVSNTEFAAFMARLNHCPHVFSAQPVQVRTGKLLEGMLVEFSVKCNIAASLSHAARDRARASKDSDLLDRSTSRPYVLAAGVNQ